MRQTITQKDIDRYHGIINQDKVQGAVAVYEELRQKGYGYAGWAHGVATGESVTGRAALGFLTDTANRELTQAEMDGIRIGMANGYLNALSANIKKDHGKTQTDITFEQMRNFHKDVFEKHHLSIDNWTLETPMYLLGKYGGGRRAQEEAWQRLAATEGYGMDALMASTSVYNMTVEFANGRVTVDRQGRFIAHNPWDSSVHLARELEKISGSGREVTISPEDKKRASSWMHYAAQYKAMGAMFAEAQQEDLQGIPVHAQNARSGSKPELSEWDMDKMLEDMYASDYGQMLLEDVEKQYADAVALEERQRMQEMAQQQSRGFSRC